MRSNHSFIKGTSPLVVAAIHDGSRVRDGLEKLFHISKEERLREEDPYTANWLSVSDNRIKVHHSRFETDVNRPREKSVYMVPEDAWGLKVWKDDLPAEVQKVSLEVYDSFYTSAKDYFDHLFTINEKIIVYDLHSYNHRREAIDIAADPVGNPEINLGTKNMDRGIWAPVVKALTECFDTYNYGGRTLDVRENVKFKGGYFGQWLYEQYGENICPISIEFKKFFMDEFTGQAFDHDMHLIEQMLKASTHPVLGALKQMNN